MEQEGGETSCTELPPLYCYHGRIYSSQRLIDSEVEETLVSNNKFRLWQYFLQ
jgi:hypothetical protein